MLSIYTPTAGAQNAREQFEDSALHVLLVDGLSRRAFLCVVGSSQRLVKYACMWVLLDLRRSAA